MRAHYLQHVEFEGLGIIEDSLRARGVEVSGTRLYAGDSLPALDDIDLLVVMGGPMSVNDEAELPWLAAEKAFIRQALTADKRVLGVCLGAQLIASALGQRVYLGAEKEIGWLPIYGNTHLNGAAFHFPDQIDVLHWHGETFDLPAGAVLLASSEVCRHQAFQLGRSVIGLQFHPEVTHSHSGTTILGNFVRGICKCDGLWKLSDFADQTIEQIRARVGNRRVICGLSGGVDSSVVAALLSKAIGRQLSCILVDNGLLRAGEKESVVKEFGSHFETDLHVVDGREKFLGDLAGVTEPQEKRRKIGHAFIECFKAEADKVDDAEFLAQGTLYPDVIESGAAPDGPAATIKLHHNVGGLPEELGFELIEPLRDLFKDEVRRLGLELGLPETMVWRHPFPGPGLAVRCLGEVTEEKLKVLRAADTILIQELMDSGWYRKTGQTFAVLLPVQSVGVMGDARTYENVLAIRSVDTSDFMTADWSHLPYDLLGRISTRIINEVKGVNRVVYDISSKPPATIEWE